MRHINAVRALSALGHESRLAIFRLLVQAGPEGLAAGAIARHLDLAPSALTFHLKDLTNAALIESRQSGRYVIYSALYTAMSALVSYLTENCCAGVPGNTTTPSNTTTPCNTTAPCDATAPSRQRRRPVAQAPVRAVASLRKATGHRTRHGQSRSKK